ncbi:MAG: L-ribulose-5-phosphate 4-epimerase [Clostridiales bacterium]|nr:L-ribulose-5-phosphate 4-epimerase [Clostridiales bacterium]
MKLEALREAVCHANLELRDRGLALFTWGNASAIDRERGLIVIKPSGVPYEQLTPELMTVVGLDGTAVQGSLRPSSDTPTHLALYRAFPMIGGVVHTHSTWATVWAQAGFSIPCLGTTHADVFHGPVPCTRYLSREEIRGEYEAETGRVIVEAFDGASPEEMPAALVAGHGPFAWGADAWDAVYNAAVLEQTALMAWATRQLRPDCEEIDAELLHKHYFRKHGPGAYYGNTSSK